MVKTWLTAEEKEVLADKAKSCGLSEAEYLRRLIANDSCTSEENGTEDDEEGEKTLYRIHISNKAYDILMDNVSQSKISRDAFLDKLITEGKVDVIPYDRINQNVFALCDALDNVNRKVESAMIIARRENKDMSDVIDTVQQRPCNRYPCNFPNIWLKHRRNIIHVRKHSRNQSHRRNHQRNSGNFNSWILHYFLQ